MISRRVFLAVLVTDLLVNSASGGVLYTSNVRSERFVSNTGSDAADGLTPGTAWQTVAKVNGASLPSNVSILFQCGGTWREQLTPPRSGMIISSYDVGAQPLIKGSNLVTGWTLETSGTYFATLASAPNDDAVWADTTTFLTKQASLAALHAAASGWFYTGTTLSVKLVGGINPTGHVIEACARSNGIGIFNDAGVDTWANISIYGIHVQHAVQAFFNRGNIGWKYFNCTADYCVENGFYHWGIGRSLTGCVVKDCTVGAINSNGLINFFVCGIRCAATTRCIVSGNYVNTALGALGCYFDEENVGGGGGAPSVAPQVTNNVFDSCGTGGCYFFASSTLFCSRNTVKNGNGLGFGVGNPRSTMPIFSYNLIYGLVGSLDTSLYNGFDINDGVTNGLLDHNTVAGVPAYCMTLENDSFPTNGWTISNNIFDARLNVANPGQGLHTGCLYINTDTSFTFENNSYTAKVLSEASIFQHPAGTYGTYSAMVAFTGETGSINPLDPGFTNAAAGDFTLAPGSPCIGAGLGGTNMGAF